MERIKIEGTKKTPNVLFDGNKGVFKIKGVAIHESPKEFFDELIAGVEDYKREPVEVLNVSFELEYFNTPTARMILSLLQKLKEVKCEVTWIYEFGDEDMLEAGEDFEDMLKPIRFKFEEKPEES